MDSHLSCKSYSQTWNSLSANSITDTYTCVFLHRCLQWTLAVVALDLAEEQRRRPPLPGGEQEQWHSETAQSVYLYENDTIISTEGNRGQM